MRVLVCMRGAPGCGKTSLIERIGLTNYALSPDDLRRQYAAPTYNVNGELVTDVTCERLVWDTLYKMLENRMKRGDFIILDSCNSKTQEMTNLKKLCRQYRYRIACIDMTDVPLEECIKRNAEREELKRVPEDRLRNMYSRFATQQIPSGIQVIKSHQFNDVEWHWQFLNEWKTIHVIGDVHGCYTALKETLEKLQTISQGKQVNEKYPFIHDDDFYIFLGDYLDRGAEIPETMRFLLDTCELPNFVYLEGNHERHLLDFVNGDKSRSSEFERFTKPVLLGAGYTPKDVKKFTQRLNQAFLFIKGPYEIYCTHGGLSAVPENLVYVSNQQIIKGVGEYEDAKKIAESFAASVEISNSGYFTLQAHGHRNVGNQPIYQFDTFNLENDVEHGGNLRAFSVYSDPEYGLIEDPSSYCIQWVETPNHVICERYTAVEEVDADVATLVKEFRNSNKIIEHEMGNISSFAFKPKVFRDNSWDDVTVKARGLFINTHTMEIVSRSYDKFFNLNERPETTLSGLSSKLVFPVDVYKKENGFLGIVGYDSETDSLFISSKNQNTGKFAELFSHIFYDSLSENAVEYVKRICKEEHVSLVFECIDPVNDPHIIKYDKPQIILLDIVQNDLTFKKKPYCVVQTVATALKIRPKKFVTVLKNWDELEAFLKEAEKEDFEYAHDEGFVYEDRNLFMFKQKLPFYRKWKHLRTVAAKTLKEGYYKGTGSLLDEESNRFYKWLRDMRKDLKYQESRRLAGKASIIELREQFWKEEGIDGNN